MKVAPDTFFVLRLEYYLLGCSCLLEGRCYNAAQINGAIVSVVHQFKSVRGVGYRRDAQSFASECLCCSKAVKIAVSGFSEVSCLPELGRDFAEEVSDAIDDSHYYCLAEASNPHSFETQVFQMDYCDTSYSAAATIMLVVRHRKMNYSGLPFDNHDSATVSKMSE